MSKLPMTPEVDAMRGINIQGNVIAPEWFNTIVRQTEKQGKKPDVMAIMLLADIVYWYRPQIERDEATGKITGYYRKFNADFLQKSYSSYAELFGVSEFVVKQSILTLESLGVIKRQLRNIKVNGMAVNNVLFLQLFPEKLQELTTPTHSKIYTHPSENLPIPIEKSAEGHSKIDTQIQILPTDYPETTQRTNNRKAKAPSSCEIDEDFDKFWNAYPRKVAKGDARKAWKALKPSEELAFQIIESVKQQAQSLESWQKDNGKFIPYPATWLRAERWNDEILGEAYDPEANLPTAEEAEALLRSVFTEKEWEKEKAKELERRAAKAARLAAANR